MGNRVPHESSEKQKKPFNANRQRLMDEEQNDTTTPEQEIDLSAADRIPEDKESAGSEGNHYSDDDTTLNAVPERDDIEYFRRYGFESAPGSSETRGSRGKDVDEEHQKGGRDSAH